MLTIAKFYFFILLFACLVFYLDTREKKKPEKKLRIGKSLIPLEYTGKNHDDWKQEITLQRMILSVKNGSCPALELFLEEHLQSENILKPINK